jgi:site-specific DNA-cytosine methylase
MNDDHGPTHLDLFSGIGGFALAAKWAGFRTVAFVELDKYCQKVLAKNFGCLGERAAAGFLCGSNLADTERSRKLQPQGTEQEQR